MKKKLLPALLAVICAIGIFGFTACGGGSDSGANKPSDKPGTEQGGEEGGGTGTGEQATGNEVTDDQWKAALSESAFANFMSAMTVTDVSDPIYFNAALDDGKYYYTDEDGNECCYSKEGENYYKYYKTVSAENFTKTDATEANFNSQFTALSQMDCLYFADEKQFFTYNEDGTYSAQEKRINNSLRVYAVTLKFESGKLVYMQISGYGVERTVTYSSYGKVNIELPQVYNDETGVKFFAGKTFLYQKVTGAGQYESAVNGMLKDATLEFSGDGTVVYDMPNGGIVHSGTYSYANGAGSIHINKSILNGEEKENDVEYPITYEDGKLSMDIGKGRVYIFTLQAD